MSENGNTERKSRKISRIMRMVAFVILVGMLLLAIIAQFTESETHDTPEDSVEATVQAGIEARLTEVVMQTGTPNPTAIQEMIDASVDATLTQAAGGVATPVPAESESETDESEQEGILFAIWNFIVSVLSSFWGLFVSLWDFAGKGGIVVQVICCAIPALAIFVGIVND